VSFPRLTGLLLVGAGVAGTVIGLAVPWARTGVTHPDGSTIAGIVLLVPLLSAARLAIRGLDRRGPSIAAGIAAVAGAIIASGAAGQVPPASGVAAGGPITVAGALTAALGWLVVLLPIRAALPPLVSAGVVVAVLALDLVAVTWGTDGRFVDDHGGTASIVPPAPSLHGERWHRSGPADRVVAALGPQLFVQDHSGVLAYATQTGRPTWQYRRSDLTAVGSTVAGDVVVTVFASGDLLLVTGHDQSTGAERFSRWYKEINWRPKSLLSTSDGHLAILLGDGVNAGDAVALDPRTGAVRWTWRPERGGGPCDVNDAAVAGPTLAVALRCRAAGVLDVVVGLSTSDGRERWAWPAAYGDGVTRGADEPTVAAAKDGFVVRFGTPPRHNVFLAAADGSAGPVYGADATGVGSLATVADSVAIFYDPGTAGGEVTAVNVRDGSAGWRAGLVDLIGWQLVSATTTPTRVYLLLTTRQPATATGPLRVVALNRSTGAVLAEPALSCGAACQESTIVADDHSVVISAPDPTAHTATLYALA
jgi:outer membrane protein assembly factor BamB